MANKVGVGERLATLVGKGWISPDDSEVVQAAPRVLERLERLEQVDERAASRLVRVAHAWRREYEREELGLPRKHYTRYNAAVIAAIEARIGDSKRILDPMAGTMERLRELEQPDRGWHRVHGNEIEQRWVDGYPHKRLRQGDARDLPYKDEKFDVIIVSPSYGNRDSDRSGEWWDNPDRKTYAAALGKNPDPLSLCVPFTDPRYKAGHTLAWAESVRVLKTGGLFVINLKNHVVSSTIQRVSQWHRTILRDVLGLEEIDDTSVATPGRHSGAHSEKRAENIEKIYIFSKPAGAGPLSAMVAERLRKEQHG